MALKFGTNYIYTKLGGYFYFGASGYTVPWFDDPLTIATNRTPVSAGVRDAWRRSATSSSPPARRATSRTSTRSPSTRQDDWRVGDRLTLNLGLRWDANVGNLPDQTTNRTLLLLRQLNDPRAQRLTRGRRQAGADDAELEGVPAAARVRLRRQRRSRTVVRGGYGHLLRPAVPEPDAVLADAERPGDLLDAAQSDQFGGRHRPARHVPLRHRSAARTAATELLRAASRRRSAASMIPDAQEPYVQKASIGFQRALSDVWSLTATTCTRAAPTSRATW